VEISPEEVQQGLKSNNVRLIDVRGADEWNTARIEGATLASKNLVDEMTASWDKEAPIVFYCHTGVRSLIAVHFFAEKGFTNVKSMAGGIEAWSLAVDPSVPRY
jgi:rhodanese-related sulfurtransferase